MIWTIREEQLIDENTLKHAGGKAREDICRIVSEYNVHELNIVCPQVEREHAGFLKKIMFHFSVKKEWDRTVNVIKPFDTLILQFPVINHSLLFNKVIKKLKKRNVIIVAIIHDLELLRMSNDDRFSIAGKWRMKREELDEIKMFDKIVVHNIKMKEYILDKCAVDEDKLEVLEIFDYLIDSDFVPPKQDNYLSCIIAGNLNKNKSGYIYQLPDSPVFELFGVNYEGNANKRNINYNGSFLPEELPYHLKGGFGLVWDGDSPNSCCGAWGEYLKYNNPHKTSLYLACGIPVIIWKNAALAEFVQEKNVGIVVNSLFEIDAAINAITDEEYRELKRNATTISKDIRNGFYTKKVLRKMKII